MIPYPIHYLLLLLLISSSSPAPSPFQNPNPTSHTRHSLGTTLVAAKFIDPTTSEPFSILSCDSRTSIGGTYVSNGSSSKITIVSDPNYPSFPLNTNTRKRRPVLVARCGATFLTQNLLSNLQTATHQHETLHSNSPTAHSVSRMLRSMLINQSDGEMQAGFLVADERQVFSVEVSGAVLDHSDRGFACSGSGGIFANGYCDEHYKERVGKDVAVKICVGAVKTAISSDGSSGGRVRCYLIEAGEITEVK